MLLFSGEAVLNFQFARSSFPFVWAFGATALLFQGCGTAPRFLEFRRPHKKCCLLGHDLGWLPREDG